MRRTDETPIDPEVMACLDAIDATLAGEPVDPRHAELAELALLLAAERPAPSAAFTNSLDEAVNRRFAPAPRPTASPRGTRRRWRLWTPAAGLAAAFVVAIVVVLGNGGLSLRTSSSSSSAAVARLPSTSAGHVKAPSQTASSAPAKATSSSSASAQPGFSGSGQASSSAPGQASSPSAAQPALSPAPQPPVLEPPANGRKIIQSGQLALTAAPSHVDDVAQQVFVVVGQARGVVNSSTVTASGGAGGYAQFQLSIPSPALAQTMAALSSLRNARVASRTDNTQDVNDQYQADVRRLDDARALRTSLLRQLANATTQTQIDSLTAQIHDAEASISSDEATLRSLRNQIAYSQVTVTINGGPLPGPVPVQGGGGGFTLGRAAHDAGRVLTVAAGVALIGAAALVPLALLGALAWWISAAVRRRRREQALDTV
jgi:hypothetical protein